LGVLRWQNAKFFRRERRQIFPFLSHVQRMLQQREKTKDLADALVDSESAN